MKKIKLFAILGATLLTLFGCPPKDCIPPISYSGNRMNLNYTCKDYQSLVETFVDTGWMYYAEIGGCYYKTSTPSHYYSMQMQDTIHVEAIPVKDKGNSPKFWNIPVNQVKVSSSSPSCSSFEGWKSDVYYKGNELLRTNFSYPPRCGDTVTKIISFKLCEEGVDTAKITLNYDSRNVRFLESRIHHLSYSNAPQPLSSSPLVYNLNGLKMGQVYNIFASFMVGCNNDSIGTFNVTTIYESGGCTITDETQKPAQKKGSPFDPNFQTVDRNCTQPELNGSCLCDTDTFEYYVQFQNIGDGPTNKVRVELNLPNQCNFDYFEITEVDNELLLNGGDTSVIYPVNNTANIEFTEVNLRGIKENVTNGNHEFGYEHPATIGWFKYKISPKINCCFNGNTLSSNASIVFFKLNGKALDPIITNTTNVAICDTLDCAFY